MVFQKVLLICRPDCDRSRHHDAAGRRGGNHARRPGPLRGGQAQDGQVARQVRAHCLHDNVDASVMLHAYLILVLVSFAETNVTSH